MSVTRSSTANASFVLDNPFAFHDRYDAEEDFSTLSEHMANNYTATNRVPDALAAELDDYAHRGKDATAMHWGMSGNTMLELHVSAIPPSRYKKAHRHSSDAFILVLSGRGYSLTWPDDRFEEHVRVEWQAGTIFVPPTYWYHQHLNPNGEPARYLAINAPNLVRNIGLRFKNQIENDRPEIRAEFEARVVEQESAEQP